MMKFKKGSRIEVLNKWEVPSGSWWPAEIVSGNGHTYLVSYGRYSGGTGTALERVPRKAIRPRPPPVEGLGSWVAGDIVEVFSNCSWKLAQVLRMDCGSHFFVRYLGSSTEFRTHTSDIRVRQCWQDDNWVVILKDCDKFSDRKTSKLLKTEGKLVCRKSQPCLEKSNCPRTSDTKKRPRVWSGVDEKGATMKIRKIEKGGTYHRLLDEKVDGIVSPRKVLGEKYKHASFHNRTGFSVTPRREEITNGDDNSYYRLELERNDTEGVSSYVDSCSDSNSPYRTFCCPNGSNPDLDNSCNDFKSLCPGRELDFPSEEAVAEKIHQLELSAYRSTMVALYASGPISWDQEAMMTNLRLMLNISNDEHLLELRNLISAEQYASFR